MHVAPPLSRMTMQTHVILSLDASGPLLRLACARACVCADGAKKCFSPIPAGTAPFRSLFSRRLTWKSRRGFYYGWCRQRKKNVNPSDSLTRRVRDGTNSSNIALIDLFRSAVVVSVLIFDATFRMTRSIAHVPRSRGLENAEGFVNTEDSLRF